MGKVTRPFYWHQYFVHKGLSIPAPGLYTCGKHLKMCIKSEFTKGFVWNLQQMAAVMRAFCWHQKLVPQGFSALPPGLYTCKKLLKMCIKSDFEEIILKLATYWQKEKAFLMSSKFCAKWIVCPCPGLYTYGETWKKMYIKSDFKAFFLNLQQMGKVIRAFCWHQKFVPKGLSALAPGLYIYIYKIIKNVYKIRFLFLSLQRMGKEIMAFCWHRKFVPKGLYALVPGLYTCIKSLKMCIKSEFEEIILKLATNGQSDKGFLLTSTFVPKGLSAPALGLYTCIKALSIKDQVSGERLQDHWSSGVCLFWSFTAFQHY